MPKTRARKSIGSIYEQEHFVQFYHAESQFLNNLKNFIGAGLKESAPCIVVATAKHRGELDAMLAAEGIDTDKAKQDGNYISLDAAETLAKFMHKGMPNKHLFMREVGDVLDFASKNGLPIRAFGEMVALLWADDQQAGAVLLESLWNEIARDYSFTLFCAYPAYYFAEKAHNEVCRNIGHLHTSIIAR
ncbi:MAG TPA: MEDS domain-containing protein, partial [Candidatus Polarisedimenticolaceae bacterium]|nr:MEDS domain-containing protein [Candidatus Polarisedimenticolaceae bacterium]